ncbi:L-aspartate oxidase [Rhizobium wenxiniae]|uniref:L-aspartate oxidase n=1 Tax=Rhizobium wenxiniae TaxID=1737357 RepID=A0A7W9YA28_9HYPH|nr:L-aspartate oxidase [Rhizobium wenxiniae]MBB6163953.1 L-aspartate oxidase [Rhizobium wenxiniae]GGG03731.1 L-aspartate oxidase [Rhizobium wenxiniae]
MTEYLDRFAGHVVVVGSGLAGLVTALTLVPQPVLLLTQAALGTESSSAWAQGGIAASLGDDDSLGLHLADTLAAGDGLCDAEVAAAILADAPAAIASLENSGVRFDRSPDGAHMLGLEAAHSRRRIVHAAGDGSGAAIVHALVEKVSRTHSITVMEDIEVRRLLKTDDVLSGLICASRSGPLVIPATQIVLATGGLGGLYEMATTPSGNYGQGIMLAARAGAKLADMEFVQFHPTALDAANWSAGRPLALVSEAVRGEGAILVNDRNERFMADQPGAELAPRDVVARAISAEIAKGNRVFLDAREALGQGFASRFPTITLLCREAGVDPLQERIPVRPAVHYHMGGVATDLQGRSTLDGLWVVGEAASTGLHGANRLASNSLLEAAVMGMRAARDILEKPRSMAPICNAIELPVSSDLSFVRPIVSRSLGVLRNSQTIRSAIGSLLPLVEKDGAATDPALVAISIAVFALMREESRGAHARTDYPLSLPDARRRRMTFSAVLATAREMAPLSLIHTA